MTGRGEPMTITIDPAVIADLHRRLDAYRRPSGVAGSGWQMGIDLDWLDDLLRYWRNEFDWDAVAARLNRHDHYRIPVTDTTGQICAIHAVIERGSGAHDVPILLLPGWPSSFLEFEDVIDRIARPEHYDGDAANGRTVVVADLPGFGLSDRPDRPIHHRAMAAMLQSLMVDGLGFDRFVVHGGDWGAVVGSWLALDYPKHVAGLHMSMLGLRPHLDRDVPLSDAEKDWLGRTKRRLDQDSGYRETQATKPNTLAVGLTDSPAALAAWMVEKYHGWSGCASDAVPSIDRDRLLTSATLYWATGAMPTANWIYWADRNEGDIGLAAGQRVMVPTGLALFDGGFFPPPPTEWAARAYNVVHRRDHPHGGHFPAWTEPAAFAEGLHSFVEALG